MSARPIRATANLLLLAGLLYAGTATVHRSSSSATPPTSPPAPLVVERTLPLRASRGVPRSSTTTRPPTPPATAASKRPSSATIASAPAPSIVVAKPEHPQASGLDWAALRQCESHGNYAANTGNGYYGAYQFSARTWHSLGRAGLAHQATPAEQDTAAAELERRDGRGQWPTCGRLL